MDKMKSIKLVIWDLDDTFWHGTLSEGEIQPIPENIELLKHLVNHGIMNSIVSKNTYEDAKNKLQELGVFEFFIFPHINWDAKGEQITKLLEQCSLRAENTLFIDDNVSNLKEAIYYNHGLHTALPEEINDLSNNPALAGKPDFDHVRLKQYKLLELKQEQKEGCSSNREFLMQSKITVEIRNDCMEQIERISDLIERSNQLNFTKKRIDTEQLISLLEDDSYYTGYVSVKDRFGDYGIVGFFAVKEGVAEHFLFSCRTIGMGVEQYVYKQIACPAITIQGPVRGELNDRESPDWINRYDKEETAEPKSRESQRQHRILIRGGCDLDQMSIYLQKDSNQEITYEFNTGIYHREHTTFTKGILEYSADEKKKMKEEIPFINKRTFKTELFSGEYDVIIISLLMDYVQCVYENIGNQRLRAAFGDFAKPITQDNIPKDLENENWDKFFSNYRSIGRISLEDFESNLEYIYNKIGNATLILINGCEVVFKHPVEKERWIYHKELNDVVDKFCQRHENVYLVDMRKLARTENDLTDNIRHYKRHVYYGISKEVADIINIVDHTNMYCKENIGERRWKLEKIIHKIKRNLMFAKGR